uniref:Uncharacterized protein n=1 Tax=Noccaea caerulescens TaxID=107243 RepID=A0A1J3HT61_NOCCA
MLLLIVGSHGRTLEAKKSALIFFFFSRICVIKSRSLSFVFQVWQTASLYHLVHAAALVSAPNTKYPNIV